MSHKDLTTSSQSVAGYDARRTFAMVTTDHDTVVHVLAADTTSVTDTTACVFVAELTYKDPVLDKLDGSTYLLYALKQGTAPSAIWVDAPVPLASTPSSSSSQGTVKVSVAPASATDPIATGSNDARVCTAEAIVGLSGTDGSLAETIVWTAPVACTVTGAYINSTAAMAADNTDYNTLTLAKRPLSAPGTPATMVAPTTKAASLNALAAFTEESLGSLSNTSFVAGDMVTFKSVASGAGKASGPALLRLTYTVP